MLLAVGALLLVAVLVLAGLYWRHRRRGGSPARAESAGRHLRGAAAALALTAFAFLLFDEAQGRHYWGHQLDLRWAEDHWLPLLWVLPAAFVWWLASRPWGGR